MAVLPAICLSTLATQSRRMASGLRKRSHSSGCRAMLLTFGITGTSADRRFESPTLRALTSDRKSALSARSSTILAKMAQRFRWRTWSCTMRRDVSSSKKGSKSLAGSCDAACTKASTCRVSVQSAARKCLSSSFAVIMSRTWRRGHLLRSPRAPRTHSNSERQSRNGGPGVSIDAPRRDGAITAGRPRGWRRRRRPRDPRRPARRASRRSSPPPCRAAGRASGRGGPRNP